MESLILHITKTIRYRFAYAISHANKEYFAFKIGKGVRTPIEIIHHMRGLMYYSVKIITGEKKEMGEITNWEDELKLFYESLDLLEDQIRKSDLQQEHYFKLTQGPLSDALTHIGQLAMISRLNDHPLDKQNFVHAKI